MNKEFLASTSVFAEMANNNVNLPQIINEFIINTYILNSTYSQNSAEIRNELVAHFDIDIPEAIIRTQLKRLTKDKVVDYIDGQYVISPTHRTSREYINKDVSNKKKAHTDIFEGLKNYVQQQIGPLIGDKQQDLENNFIEYLFDSSKKEDEFSGLISAYVVKNEKEENFRKELNLIREGSIILKGLYYTTDFNDLTIWRNDLTIYMDTEHLLSLTGLNGDTFKLMLMDFYNLVRDINSKVAANGAKKIHLKYTLEVKKEIESIFYVGHRIVAGKATLQPGKTAIKNIVQGCGSPTDITRKTSEFFTALKSLGIYEADSIDLFEKPQYNVVDPSAMDKYSKEKTEEDINRILEQFTFINVLRNGRNDRGFENIGHILMTGDRVTRMMSYDNELKISDSDFSFATDVFYVTQRLWFKLNRGLGFSESLPATLDVVNKARVILSSQINSSVRARYNKIGEEIKNGERTEEELKDYYFRLRANTFSPEEITSENIAEHINFIYSNNDLENYLRNKSSEKSELEARKIKVNALEEISIAQSHENIRLRNLMLDNEKNSAERLYLIYKYLALAVIISIVLIIGFLSYFLKQENDTIIATISFGLLILTVIMGVLTKNKIENWLREKAFKSYKELKYKENQSH